MNLRTIINDLKLLVTELEAWEDSQFADKDVVKLRDELAYEQGRVASLGQQLADRIAEAVSLKREIAQLQELADMRLNQVRYYSERLTAVRRAIEGQTAGQLEDPGQLKDPQ